MVVTSIDYADTVNVHDICSCRALTEVEKDSAYSPSVANEGMYNWLSVVPALFRSEEMLLHLQTMYIGWRS